jgi:MYXO-CTERM domain-containing protein
MKRLVGAVMGLVAGLYATASSSWAYVRTRANGGPVVWRPGSVTLILYAGSPPPDLTRETLVSAVRAAAATWSYPAVSCTKLQVSVLESDEPSGSAAFDRTNRITFRQDQWRRSPCDPSAQQCAPYGSQVLAVTSVFSRPSDGAILDADIEINAVPSMSDTSFVWADLLKDPLPDHQDVQNVLTHELGHVIGLDHNCYVAAGRSQASRADNLGRPVPSCAEATAELREATMYPSARPGETEKRDLSPDDVQGVCGVYPAGEGGEGGGCAVGTAAPGRGGLAVGLLGLAALARRRRRTGVPAVSGARNVTRSRRSLRAASGRSCTRSRRRRRSVHTGIGRAGRRRGRRAGARAAGRGSLR